MFTGPGSRRFLVVSLAVTIVIVYSVLVLLRVASTHSLRVVCLLEQAGDQYGLRIEQVEDAQYAPGVQKQRELEPGDYVMAIGGVPIHHFVQFRRVEEAAYALPISRQAALDTTERIDWSRPDLQPPEGASEPWVVGLRTEQENRETIERIVPVDFLRITETGKAEQLRTWVQLQPVPTSSLLLSIGWLLLKLMIFAIGAVVLLYRPHDVSAHLFFALCAVTVMAYIGGFHWRELIGRPLLLYGFAVCAILVPPVTVHFYLTFPRAHRLLVEHRRWTLLAVYGPPILWLVAIIAAVASAHVMLDAAPATDGSAQLVGWWLSQLTWLVATYLFVAGGLFAAGLGVLVHRYFSSRSGSERNQVKWILLAAVLAAPPMTWILAQVPSNPAVVAVGSFTKPAMLTTSLMLTLAYAVSITRYKLIAAGRLMSRWFLYALLSGVATGLFCLLTGAWALMAGTEPVAGSTVAIVGLTVLLMLWLMGWLGENLQRWTHSRFYRDKYQLDQAMRRLSRAVDQLIEPVRLVDQMLRTATESVQATRGAVYLATDPKADLELISSVGRHPMPPTMARDCALARELRDRDTPLRVFQHEDSQDGSPAQQQLLSLDTTLAVALQGGKQVVGLMLIGPRSDGVPYSNEDQNFLVTMARTTGLLLQSAQGHRIIASLRRELESKVAELAEHRARILFLQGELLNREADPNELAAADPAALTEETGLRHNVRGSSPAVRGVLSQVARISKSAASVLIRGESGTGKELLAQAIHENSPRHAGPFVPVHCAALSAGLLESELFGHVKGAFTGADRDKIGRFERANGGTLFLDEIGDISLDVQTKLLRVLQEHSFERVGSNDSLKVDVRLIAATHRPLEQLIREGKFREDLFYRLNVISLWAPPLRERGDDILELSLHFLQHFARESGKRLSGIDPEAMSALKAYSWPGNVRQLENAIERAVVLAQGNLITLTELPPEVVSGDEPGQRYIVSLASNDSSALGNWKDSRDEDERQMLVDALDRAGGNKTQAARLLEMHRSTFFSKLKKHGLLQ